MSVEVADLLLRVRSDEAREAKSNLDALAISGSKAEDAVDRLGASSNRAAGGLKKTGTEAKSAKAGFTTLTEELIKTRGASGLLQQDLDQIKAKFVPAAAASNRYEQALREIADAERVGAITAREAQAARASAAASLQPLAKGLENVANKQIYVSNAFAQSNDILMMALSGQSPMVLAMQQGMQLNQLWGQMGGGIKAIGSVMVSAFTTMLNPVNLLTIGLIAGGAALLQWAIGADEASDKTKTFSDQIDEASSHIETLKSLTSSLAMEELDALKNKYGEVTTGLLDMIRAQQELEDRLARSKLTEALSGIQEEFSQTTSQWLYSLTDGASESERSFNELMVNLQSQMDLTETQAYQLAKALSQAFSAKTPQEQVVALGNVRVALSGVASGNSAAAIAADNLRQKTLAAEDAARQLVAVAPPANWLGLMIDQAVLLSGELSRALSLKSQLSFGTGVGGMEIGHGFSNGSSFSMSDGSTVSPYLDPNPKRGGGGGGGGGGGQSKSDQTQKELDKLRESLMTETELYMQEYQKQQELLQTSLQLKLITKDEYNKLEQEMQREHQEKLREINETGLAGDLQSMSSYFGELYSMSGSRFSGLLKLQRTFASASALINAWKAFNEVLADPYYVGRPWARVAAAGRVLAAGLGAVNAIRSGSSSSSSSKGGSASESSSPATEASAPQSVILDFSGTDPALMAFAKMLIDPMVAQLQKVSKVGVNIAGVQY